MTDRANAFEWFQAVNNERLARARIDGSPPYRYTLAALGPGADASIRIDKQFPASRKYAPLDYVEVINNDTLDLTVYINGSDIAYPVPAGTTREIRNAIHEFKFHNDDAAGTTTLNKIYATFKRAPMDADRKAAGE